ncbi:tail fiber domain-containing protein [Phocaeicola barnesiae]|uniref:Tail fiber domain-containing protein n=1 Tax=Phocaeicola barnesiae TaxID=376804 RepID=A0AAW5N6R6_9BACT|nr:tail fiber domain-containing protein [Phocaeicola barnesiae]MCR8874301.1 tail fiber domain-containing protein [Phocaeicola barnesiae]
MKQVTIINKVIPAESRSKYGTSGRSSIISGVASVDLSPYLLKAIWERNFEERKDEAGNEYIYIKKPIVGAAGMTLFAGDEIKVDSIFKGLPIDAETLQWVDGVLTVVGGGTGGGASNWDELEGKPSWITDTKPTYAWGEITQKPTTLSGYGIQASDVLNTLKTVDGSGSGLDADTLDGYDSLDTITFGGDINTAASYVAGLKVFGIEGGNSSGLGNGYGSILQLCNGLARKYAPNTSGLTYLWYSQLILTTDRRVRARFSTNGSEWSTQLTIAYITDNVASATKLQTARTIWGQSFDGTANVTGSLTSVTDITGTGTFTGANIKATDSVYVNGIRLHKTADGVITLEGNLAVTGGITQFAVNEVNSSTIMDGVVVDGTSIKKENGVLKVMNAGGGEAGSVKWANIEGKPTTLAGYSITASDVLSTLKTVDGSGSRLDADLLDGVHLISNGYGAGVKRTFFFDVSINKSYIKLGTLRTVAGTGTSTSKVMFTVRGGINYGNTNESVYEVAASTRGSIQVTSTLVRGNRELKFGYVSTSSNVEIWMAYDDNYRGTTEVEVSASSNFILSMTETNTKPSGFVEGSYRILAATTDNVTSATNADKLDGVHLNGVFTAFIASGNNTRLTIGGVTKDLTVPYANNADMLDGVQLANIVYYANTNSYDNTICSRIIPISDVNLTDEARWGSIFQWTNNTTKTPAQTGTRDNWFNQLFGATNNRIYFRTRTNGGGWTPWNKLAYITDNVASATKLQTARNLWGQSFDGTKDVTGSMTVNGNITIANGSSSTLTIWDSSAYIQQQNISDLDGYGLYLYGSSGTRIANKLVVDSDTYIKRNITVKGTVKGTGTNGGFGIIPGHVSGECIRIDCHNSSGNWITNGIIILSNGYTGIGTATPSQRLHVAGNILATGGGTFYSSDIRAKTIIERPKLSLNSIANAPVIKFRWNGYNDLKDDDKLHIGGIAQYIEKILPECVVGQKDDFLSFDYATTGYVFSVLTARHLLSYETRTDRIIRKLKERIKRLEKQLNIENHEEVSIVAD